MKKPTANLQGQSAARQADRQDLVNLWNGLPGHRCWVNKIDGLRPIRGPEAVLLLLDADKAVVLSL